MASYNKELKVLRITKRERALLQQAPRGCPFWLLMLARLADFIICDGIYWKNRHGRAGDRVPNGDPYKVHQPWYQTSDRVR
jgi:hypothetical protein